MLGLILFHILLFEHQLKAIHMNVKKTMKSLGDTEERYIEERADPNEKPLVHFIGR
ncbi:hypothetical protein I592_00613 [Enterococcus gilvus ATCC BAA-350]|uniref:Uncharacterized protein n=1 Tax=Enterococcus gilvus ATCC BAA-350 TaxID=1158614 RepID=R2XTT6_9ENTE|nr:hypothetical protein UKC_03349 [Enterococcus gilvus ATCC BAA-350]EOW81328.1 hypothetical protein I592_00613 [Enterococcus gilvus ATCC BAA-350]